MKIRRQIIFYLNGIREAVDSDFAGMMLADYLRLKKHLTGTKIVCAEGDCGACSVLRLTTDLQNPRSASGKRNLPRFIPINSCITLVAQMDGCSLITVDALSSENRAGESRSLSPVQKAMVDHHGSQCGFCTPGFVVAITGLVEKKLGQGMKQGFCSEQEAKNCMTGNLCRCTGYQPILRAAMSVDLAGCESLKKRFVTPAQTEDLARVLQMPVFLKSDRFQFYAPTRIKDAVLYLAKHKTARILGSGTDLGVVHNKGKIELSSGVSLHLIPELYSVKKSRTSLRIGARVSLSEVRRFTKNSVPEFSRFLDLFASPQIKNLATLVGNIGNASPIADTPPFLLTANAVLHLIGPRGPRKVPLEKFYLGYQKTTLKPHEIITAVEFEIPKKSEKIALYKSSQRKDLDISCVNAAFRLDTKRSPKTGGHRIQSFRLALGGIAAIPKRMAATESYLQGKIFGSHSSHDSDEILTHALQILQTEITPLDDARGSAKFRRALVSNFFWKFFRELSMDDEAGQA